MRIKLEAALHTLDAYGDMHDVPVDINQVRQAFGLPALTPLEIETEQQINTCDTLQMMRINVEELSAEQLFRLLPRAQLINHRGFLDRVVGAVTKYPELLEPERYAQLLHAYIDLARYQPAVTEQKRRIEVAKAWSAQQEQTFEQSLQWEIREMQYRVVQPDEPGYEEFFEHFYQKYVRKFPDLQEMVEGYLEEQGVVPPWKNKSAIVTSDSIEGSDGLQSSSSAGNAGSKLWLPGQR